MAKKKKLQVSYAIAIIPDDGSETKSFSGITLSRLMIAVSSLCVFVALSASALIVLTPVKRLIPGYGEAYRYEQQLIANQNRLDSLSKRVMTMGEYNRKLMAVLSGDSPKSDSIKNIVQKNSSISPSTSLAGFHDGFKMNPSADVFKLASNELPSFISMVVRGTLSQGFMPDRSHYGIDVATPLNEPIGAIADGTILFADYTTDFGYTIIIQHGALTSFYKHCNRLLVREGDTVKRGEVIALTGNTGRESSGAHLHIEIWKNGVPQNPENYLSN